jgi:hypothetical protein
MSTHRPPEILDKIADLVLAFRPKPKTSAAKKRKKAAKKKQREMESTKEKS